MAIAVTGAAQGQGYAIARYHAARGANISIADIKKTGLEAAAETIRREPPEVDVIAAVVSVSKSAAVDERINNTVSKFGKLDGAANNAGIVQPPTVLKDLTNDLWDCVLRTNLTRIFNCLRAELRVIEKGGSIVSTSSIAEISGFQGVAVYAASKHGVMGLTKSAAKEVGANNIRANAICPGAVATAMLLDEYKFPTVPRRIAAPEEITSSVALLLGPKGSYTTGQAYAVDGGWVC